MIITQTGRYIVKESVSVAGSWNWHNLPKGTILNVTDIFSNGLIRLWSPGVIISMTTNNLPVEPIE